MRREPSDPRANARATVEGDAGQNRRHPRPPPHVLGAALNPQDPGLDSAPADMRLKRAQGAQRERESKDEDEQRRNHGLPPGGCLGGGLP